jgi:hypothetical protein
LLAEDSEAEAHVGRGHDESSRHLRHEVVGQKLPAQERAEEGREIVDGRDIPPSPLTGRPKFSGSPSHGAIRCACSVP